MHRRWTVVAVMISLTATTLLLAAYLKGGPGMSQSSGDGHIVLLPDVSGAGGATSAPQYYAALADGNAPDGIRVDSRGALIVDPALRASFDYFLSTTEDLSSERKLAVAERHLAAKLSGPALTKARALLERYAAYLNETGRAEGDARARQGDAVRVTGLDDLERKLATRRALREKYLGTETTRSWFGEQDGVDQIALKRARLWSSPLPEKEKRERLALLDAQLPLDVQRQRAAISQPARILDSIETMRKRGASDDAIRLRLGEDVDYAATGRLSAMLRNDADWDKRYQDYARERGRIEQTPGLGNAERARQVANLRAGHFPKDSDALIAQTRDRLGN